MKKRNVALLLVLALVIAGAVFCFIKYKAPEKTVEEATTYEETKTAFPESLSKYDKYVIDLDKKIDEDKFEVEVLAGKTDEFDCNNQMLSGTFETKTIDGFGYEYYMFKSDGNIASTLMACPDETLTEKFISQSIKIRYNSQLPIVVFVPEGFQVKYNVWEMTSVNTEAVLDIVSEDPESEEESQ